MWSFSIKLDELRHKNVNNTFMIKRKFTSKGSQPDTRLATLGAIAEPPLPENKPHIPPPSVEAARRTYSTKKIAKNDKNSNLKGKIPTNSKKLARKKLK